MGKLNAFAGEVNSAKKTVQGVSSKPVENAIARTQTVTDHSV